MTLYTQLEKPVTLEQYGRCSDTMRMLGNSYPKTCLECGLGPCKIRLTPSTQLYNSQKYSTSNNDFLLPKLPHHPEHSHVWSESESKSIDAYGKKCFDAGVAHIKATINNLKGRNE